ncbi:MAG: TetR/AcrR family transcriptional regulator [Thermoanaerobaculia bacterium]
MSEPESTADPRERILRAAADIFAAEGFAGARVDEIARRAGVNKAMVYYHVGDKEALYSAVFLATIARATAAITSTLAQHESPEEQIRAAVRTMIGMTQDNPHFPPMVLREFASGGAGIGADILGPVAGIYAAVGEALARGTREGRFRKLDPTLSLMMVAGAVMVLVAARPLRQRLRELRDDPREETPEILAQEVAEVILHGICRPQPEPRETNTSGRAKRSSRSTR